MAGAELRGGAGQESWRTWNEAGFCLGQATGTRGGVDGAHRLWGPLGRLLRAGLHLDATLRAG